MPPQPPCYVLGLETQIGLAIVRELGRAGVPVIGIAQNPRAIALRSRYLNAAVVVRDLRSAEGVIALREFGERFGAGVLLAVSEQNLAWLIEHSNELGGIRPIVPPLESFTQVLNKVRTLDVARQVGIPVPESAVPTTWTDVERIATSFPFPAVLKWPDPAMVREILGLHGLRLEKAEHVRTGAEFLTAASRYLLINRWPMVQEYCPGVGLGQFFYMHKRTAIRRFQHIRVAEWPPEGGFSSVCDAVPLDRFRELQELSIALLREIGWEGQAMVEYRYDPTRDRAMLMEINGRFWGSYPLAVASGAGFAHLAYSINALGKLPELPMVSSDLRCRMVTTEIKRLIRILLSPKKIRDPRFKRRPLSEIVRFLADFMKKHVCYYVWAKDDPMPFFADVLNAIRRR